LTKPQGLLQARNGLFQLAQFPQGISEVTVRHGEVRLAVHGLPKAGHGLGQLSLKNEHISQVVMCGGKVGLLLQGRPEVLHSDIVTACLPGDYSQEMERIDLVRIDLQDLLEVLFRLLQPAGLIIMAGYVQRLRYRL
jgi:hypothetical protein